MSARGSDLDRGSYFPQLSCNFCCKLGKHEDESQWQNVFEKAVEPSPQQLQRLEFRRPFRVKPGSMNGLYVHSKLFGDQAIVYDNQRSRVTLEDEHLQALPGYAHLSGTPFSPHAWGWGTWRDQRVFVGRVSYDIRYLLWNPDVHQRFHSGFRRTVVTMLMCQRREESPLSLLGDDCLFYIFNMLDSEWVPELPPEPITSPLQACKLGYKKLNSGMKSVLDHGFFEENWVAFAFFLFAFWLCLDRNTEVQQQQQQNS